MVREGKVRVRNIGKVILAALKGVMGGGINKKIK